MTRRAHYLRGHKANQMPSRCLWFDTESRQKQITSETLEHHLTFGWSAFSRKTGTDRWRKAEWERFTRGGELYDIIDGHAEKKTKLYVFCHNTSFDLPLSDVFGNMKRLGYTLKSAVIDAPPTILTFNKGSASIIFLDTLNLFRMSLKELGERVGLEKFDMPDVTIDSAEGDKYCKRDVEIIMKAVMDWFTFIEDHDLGGFSPTLASQSFRAYRHRFMHHKILIDDNENGTALSRSGYYGGRTECFKLGHFKEPLYLLDLNSQYPAAMRNGLYPTSRLWNITKVREGKLAEWLEKYCVMARVTLQTDQPIYAKATPEKLMFPVGRFDTVLSSPELRLALARDHIVKVHQATIYQCADIFSEFVDYFHNMRRKAIQEGNKTEAFLLKTTLVSLYGKFGQRGIVWEADHWVKDLSTMAWKEISATTGEKTRFRRLGGLVQKQLCESEGRDSHPAIAAHVTAYGRVMLWELIETAGRENVFYCDTDGILVNSIGYDRLKGLIHPDRLGALKLEGVFSDCEIYGPKDYRFGERLKVKGVKRKAVWHWDNIIEQDQWSSLKGLVNSGSVTKPTTKKIYKVLKRQYNKGTVLKDGSVQPFLLTA